MERIWALKLERPRGPDLILPFIKYVSFDKLFDLHARANQENKELN